MKSFKNCPKIFIVDACRACSLSKHSHTTFTTRGPPTEYCHSLSVHGYHDDHFLTIWSTTNGHVVSDLSLLSECMKDVFVREYSKHTLQQMLYHVRQSIRQKKWAILIVLKKIQHFATFASIKKN